LISETFGKRDYLQNCRLYPIQPIHSYLTDAACGLYTIAVTVFLSFSFYLKFIHFWEYTSQICALQIYENQQ